MRKLLICCLLFVATNVYCQQIQGMGELKIGMSSEEFLGLPVIMSKNLREKTKTFESPKQNEIFRTSIDTKYEQQYIGSTKIDIPKYEIIFSPDVIKYEFIFPLGIVSHLGKDEYRLKVTFYKDKLSRIEASDATSEFKKILSEKYGKSRTVDLSKMEVCQNGYGAKTEHLTGSITEIWGDDGNIEAAYSFGNFSCGKYPHMNYRVSNKIDVQILNKIQSDGVKNLEAEQVKEKVSGSKL